MTELHDFLTDIALDPAKLADYLQDPAAAVRQAGLSAPAQQALLAKEQGAVLERLAQENGGQGYKDGYRAFLKLGYSPTPVELFTPLHP